MTVFIGIHQNQTKPMLSKLIRLVGILRALVFRQQTYTQWFFSALSYLLRH